MPDSLTPAERTMRSRMGAYRLHSLYDAKETTAKARAAGPGQVEYWLAKVDPENKLDAADRLRRAEAAKREHFTRLAFLSARARRRGSA